MQSLLSANHIVYAYPGKSHSVLCGCTLSIKRGDLFCILGPNGSGKSTLLNCLCGLLLPNQGEVLLMDKSIHKLSPKSIARHIGYVSQNQSSAFGYTVMDYVLMGRANMIGLFDRPTKADFEVAKKSLEVVGIACLGNCLLSELSGGERQLVSIARVVAQNPEVIMLDEPTAHLDYGNQIKMLKLIEQLNHHGFSILITTHNPDHCIMLNSQVGILDKTGVLHVGTCEKMLSDDTLSTLLGAEIHMVYADIVKRNTFVLAGLDSV